MSFTFKTQVNNTPRNDGADNNICYLDRHAVVAPAGQILVGFRLRRDGGKMWYEYTSATVTSSDPSMVVTVGPSTEASTAWQDGAELELCYLDRQNITLPVANTVLTGFKLERNGGQIRYKYWYAQLLVNGGKQQILIGDAKTTSTTFTDGANNKQPCFLDRHTITAGTNRVLTGFHAKRNGGNLAYDIYSAALTGVKNLPISFTITTSKKETARNDGADNNICYLDRHTVRAPAGQIIVGFKVRRDAGKIWYEYTVGTVTGPNASVVVTVGPSTETTTSWQVGAEEELAYLDRQLVKTPVDNTVLTGFRLERNGNLIRYRYWYAHLLVNGGSQIVIVGDSQTTSTAFSDGATRKEPCYLDRHDIAVGANRILSGFRAKRDGSNLAYNIYSAALVGVKDAGNIPVLQVRSPEKWMSVYKNLIQEKSFGEICVPGTHDAGMGPSSTKFPNFLSTFEFTTAAFQTQDFGVGGQLERGARWIELRPMLDESGKYTTYHGTGQMGGTGQSFDSIIAEVNAFMAKNPQEIVVLTLSNGQRMSGYQGFNNDDWNTFLTTYIHDGTRNKFNNALTQADLTACNASQYLVTGQPTTNYFSVPVKHFFGKVIVLVNEGSSPITDATKVDFANRGIFGTNSFSVVDTGYEDSSTMSKDEYFNRQLTKMEGKTEKRARTATPLVLNWTLTQSTTTAIISTLTRVDSIKDLSLDEHAYLVSHFQSKVQANNFTQYANVIPIDFCDTNVLNTVFWLLENLFK